MSFKRKQFVQSTHHVANNEYTISVRFPDGSVRGERRRMPQQLVSRMDQEQWVRAREQEIMRLGPPQDMVAGAKSADETKEGGAR